MITKYLIEFLMVTQILLFRNLKKCLETSLSKYKGLNASPFGPVRIFSCR